MGGLRDKLSRLDNSSVFRKEGSRISTEISDEWVATVARELQIKVLKEANAFFFLRERVWPVFQDAAFSFMQQRGFVSERFPLLIGNGSPASFSLRQTVFFDLETTGLAGGTGTYAFLIGIGTVENDAIRVRQYLLPDFSNEWLLLRHLVLIFQEYPITVSFNGKTFDIPFLGNRFILNQMENVLEDLFHVDVLHISRRIWRHVLPTCDLQTLEKHVLGKERVEDIPGNLIPHLYFDFIRKRQAWLMEDVLAHNFQDIVNMVLLTIRLVAIAEAPLLFLTRTEEKLALASYFVKQRHIASALPILQELITNSQQLSAEQLRQAYWQFARVLKLQGDSAKASQYLWELLERNQWNCEVVEELAKYYEHREKNYAIALQLVERALQRIQLLEQLGVHKGKGKTFQALQHRKTRLMRKIRKQQPPTTTPDASTRE